MTDLKKIMTTLALNKLELHVHLGWPDEEREEIQTILANIDIVFSEPPKACVTDNLHDTFCYADIIEKIKIGIANKKFRLIEHLAQDIYHLITKQLPDDARVMVHLTKFPSIEGLRGGACFSYGDE